VQALQLTPLLVFQYTVTVTMTVTYAESIFLSSSFLMDDLLCEKNKLFFYLTAQNFRICKDVWVSCIMF
jgi:hypothetical protein